ncbi:MAG: bifunctional 4-phosphopantothenoylcysteine decarboxylase/phosphopantothenoylcysteine synthetase [Bacillales bacterium]|jgi:phosphopantothenoylcysteine decarboxylase/phosphopantothenate--cysteine ligase|nr:bifunctional 4-phosphopantothenoylcysteine decarboxylase/phosphopantothenoylcysteine synthetase [Bacillales bacterium]
MRAPNGETINQFMNKTFVVGITGGIASYKAIGLCSYLKQQGASVFPVMTRGAAKMIQPASVRGVVGRDPLIEVWEEPIPNAIAHIYLAEQAHAIIVAPATAHTIAKHHAGLADDMLTNILLATENKEKILFCPAMNVHMWQHPATQRNVNEMKSWGIQFLEPTSGNLACGVNDVGRLPETPEIVAKIKEMTAYKA